MALIFDNVSILTYQHSPVFFGAGLRYKIQKSFTIAGTLLDLANNDGVAGTVGRSQTLQANAHDYQPIILNGVDFGMGKILNIDFESDRHVKLQKYIYQIVAYSEGNLFNAVSNEYSGIDWSNIHCIDRLDESFNMTEADSGDKSYEHSISIRYNKDVNNLSVSPIALAKSLAQNLMSALNLIGFLGDYGAAHGSKRIYTEAYNVIDNVCSFTEHVEIPVNSQGDYSVAFNYSINLNEKGITNVTERGLIKGIINPVSSSATEGYQTQTVPATILARVTAVYNAYGFSTLPLSDIAISKSAAINKFDGTIDYSQTFTNDPRINDYAVWEYTTHISRSQDNYIEVSESGSVKGIGRPRFDKYQNALAFYAGVESGISGRISAAYSAFGGIHAGNLTRIKKGFSKVEYVGEINYNETWTDNNLYVISATVRKQEIEIITAYPVQIVYNANIFNVKQLIQPQNNSTVGKRNINIKLRGLRVTTIDDYVSYCKQIVNTNQYNIIGTDPYISSCHYNFSPNRNEFSFSAEIAFHGFYKAFEDLTLT